MAARRVCTSPLDLLTRATRGAPVTVIVVAVVADLIRRQFAIPTGRFAYARLVGAAVKAALNKTR